jgi:hypothetical protein
MTERNIRCTFPVRCDSIAIERADACVEIFAGSGPLVQKSFAGWDSLREMGPRIPEHLGGKTALCEGASVGIGNTSVRSARGREFFLPKRLEFSAQPYGYNSLGSVKKVGSNWELEIKGADEPNRATVLLDSEFKLVNVTKNADRGH